MSFPDLITAGFLSKEDSSKFQDAATDPALKYEMQGGLTVSRKRFTRSPPRIITTGFSFMPQSDKALLDTFFQVTVSGGAVSFQYTHPVSGEVLTVRFDKEWKTEYVGHGTLYLWSITDIMLRTV